MLQFVLFLFQNLKLASRAIYVILHQKWCEIILDLFLFQFLLGYQQVCYLFAKFIEHTRMFPSSSGRDLVNDDLSFRLLQFTVLEVENVLLWLDSSKSLVFNSVL
jgi:hypothetical protein